MNWAFVKAPWPISTTARAERAKLFISVFVRAHQQNKLKITSKENDDLIVGEVHGSSPDQTWRQKFGMAVARLRHESWVYKSRFKSLGNFISNYKTALYLLSLFLLKRHIQPIGWFCSKAEASKSVERAGNLQNVSETATAHARVGNVQYLM